MAALVFVFFSCTRAGSGDVRTEFVMGTICSVTLFDNAKNEVYSSIFARLREIENRMSANIKGSDVDLINTAAGIAPVVVHGDVFAVIEKALYYAEISDGAFNPAVGPLVSLWDIGGENFRVPPRAEIENTLPLIAWRDIELNRDTGSVFLKKAGMKIDLGAIAKGYAADEAALILARAGIKRAIIDLGGNILTFGEKQDKSPWRVGIQSPFEERGSYIGVVRGEGQSVVTSGVYERFSEADGKKYHHIFSASDGYPASNGLSSVTIIAERSIDADSLSTAVFVLGYEKGKALVDALDGIEAVFIFEDGTLHKTSGADFVPAE